MEVGLEMKQVRQLWIGPVLFEALAEYRTGKSTQFLEQGAQGSMNWSSKRRGLVERKGVDEETISTEVQN